MLQLFEKPITEKVFQIQTSSFVSIRAETYVARTEDCGFQLMLLVYVTVEINVTSKCNNSLLVRRERMNGVSVSISPIATHWK